MTSLDERFIKAASKGNLKEVKYCLDMGAGIHAEDNCALRLASRNGQFKVVEYLIEKGVDVTLRFYGIHLTPVQEAAANGNLKIVEILYNEGANIREDGDTALKEAASNGHVKVMDFLLEKGADYRVLLEDSKVLERIIERRHKEVHIYLQKLLLKEKEQEDLNKLFVFAAKKGDLEELKSLKEKGANIHYNKDEALCCAAEAGQNDAVEFLLKNGADIHVKEDMPLFLAAQTEQLKTVKLLLKNGANLYARNGRAFLVAIKTGNLKIVKYLVKKGANINSEYMEPMETAIQYNQFDIVKFFIKKGVNIHSENHNPISFAAQKGRLKILKLLYKKGADINIFKGAPMRSAAANCQIEVLKFLVDECGARFFVDEEGDTVLEYTVLNGCVKGTEFLVNKGLGFNFNSKRIQERIRKITNPKIRELIGI